MKLKKVMVGKNTPVMGERNLSRHICQFCQCLCNKYYSFWYKNLLDWTSRKIVFHNIPCCLSSYAFNFCQIKGLTEVVSEPSFMNIVFVVGRFWTLRRYRTTRSNNFPPISGGFSRLARENGQRIHVGWNVRNVVQNVTLIWWKSWLCSSYCVSIIIK